MLHWLQRQMEVLRAKFHEETSKLRGVIRVAVCG